MADRTPDLGRIQAAGYSSLSAMHVDLMALVAEVRRLRAIEDAARALLEAEGLPMFPKSVRSRRLRDALEADRG